jgi:diguanylate cyclase
LLADLAAALERCQLSVVYQPIFDSKTHAVTALEALLRWEHPVHGAISPAEFITYAESSDLIIAIGDWVIATVCRQIAVWSAFGYHSPRVCINASTRQFEDPGFACRVQRLLRSAGVRPDQIELELTETRAFVDFDAAALTMDQLRSGGIALSIDDFGAGSTSLILASTLPMRTLKIDRCLTSSIASDRRKQAIVAHVVSLSRALGMRTVAEGVDCPETARLLEQIGCDELQGYYLARPLHADGVADAFYWRFPDLRAGRAA